MNNLVRHRAGARPERAASAGAFRHRTHLGRNGSIEAPDLIPRAVLRRTVPHLDAQG